MKQLVVATIIVAASWPAVAQSLPDLYPTRSKWVEIHDLRCKVASPNQTTVQCEVPQCAKGERPAIRWVIGTNRKVLECW